MRIGAKVAVGLIGLAGLALVVLLRPHGVSPDPRLQKKRNQEKREVQSVPFKPQGAFDIVVLDAEDRTPLHEAQINLTTEAGAIRGVTDHKGIYRLPNEARIHSLVAQKTGYVQVQRVIKPEHFSPLEILLPPVPRIVCTFMMEDRPVKVSGIVRVGLTSGQPNSFHPLLGKPVSAETLIIDLSGLNSASQLKLVGELKEYAMTPTVVTISPHRSTHPVTVQISPAVECQGRVLDERGLPVAEAWVYADIGGRPHNNTTTDASGQFTLYGLQPELVKLAAVQEGYTDAHLEVNLLTTRFVEFTLTRGSSVFITGRVSDDAGQPIPGVEIDSLSGATSTGQDGMFRLQLSESMINSQDLFSLKAQKKGFADLRFSGVGVPLQFLELKMYLAGALTFEQSGSGATKYRLELVSAYGSPDPKTVRYFKSGFSEGFTPPLNSKSRKYESTREGLLPGLYQVTVSPGEENERKVFAEVHPGKQATIRID